jgi:hypothetical protein
MTDEQPVYEELAAPRPNRLVQVLMVLVALLVAVVVIIRIADSGSSSEHAAPTTPTVIASPTVLRVPYTPPPDRPVVVPPFRHAPPCPRADDGLDACTTFPGLPVPTARALHERFPRIVVERAVTQMLRPSGPEVRPGMWSRDISARVSALRLRIAIRRAEPRDSATTGLRQSNRLQLIRYIRGPYLVQVELRGPVMPESLTSTIAWLLNDPRLVRPALARGGTMVR